MNREDIQKELEEILEGIAKKTSIKLQKRSENNHTNKNPQHNSLQHDSTVSVPLLSLLVDALKKEPETKRKEDTETAEKETLTDLTEEANEEEAGEDGETISGIKDPIAALADRIKRMYAGELQQQAYAQNSQAQYNSNAHYQTDLQQPLLKIPNMLKAGYENAGANSDLLPKAIKDENSTGYKLSKGDKYQAFIMTDPRGRLHSTWEIVRVMNETYDGKIERNDGLHSQGL